MEGNVERDKVGTITVKNRELSMEWVVGVVVVMVEVLEWEWVGEWRWEED